MLTRRTRFCFLKAPLICVLGLIAVWGPSSRLLAAPGDVTTDGTGVTLETSSGLTRVEIWGNRIARVLHTPTTTMPSISSLAVTGTPAVVSWQYQNFGSYLSLVTPAISVRIDSPSGKVSISDQNGVVLAESASGTTLTGTTVGSPAVPSYAVTQKFDLASGEAIYGLGQHQAGIMNYVGQSVTLLQKNMEVGLPVWLSNKGYAVLWDNPAVSTIDVGKTTAGKLSWSSEAGDAVNYFFCYGPEADQAIAGYRSLTGAAPMFGKWAWGYWQSKERYQTQTELLNVSGSYRSLGIPIDGIIQDWRYWPDLNQTTAQNGWGSHVFDPSRYPDPAGLMNTLHSQHIHTLISVWAKYEVTNSGTSIPNLQAFEAVGAAFNPAIAFVYPAGQGKWYDPFNTAGRQVFWNQISQQIFSYGWDGWWLDASEPELSGNWGEFRNFNTAMGPGAKLFNAYPLMHTKSAYDGQRAETSQKRAIILTRSAYAGQQRHAAITWSGDINGSWSVFANQIPAGLNFTASGIPYWNTDIGGFGSGDPSTAAYAELYTRWFQYGAFCPMFRSHGTNYAKEVWRFPVATQAILKDYINLRYRLMPYIYSTAWKVTSEGYTMMRPLVMDFRSDAQVNSIGNQFMFGPGLLVNPVTSSGATSRNVYLPATTKWWNFWTGINSNGGQTVTASAPIQTMPIYVKAGSIIPWGPSIQYATEKLDPIELRVYPGADGSFTLYEDENDNYNYESGSYATIPFSWNEATQTLTIGARQGSFPGMLSQRTFKVTFVSPVNGKGLSDSTPDFTVTYDGTAQTVTRPALPALPGAPTGVQASYAPDQVTVSWNAPAANVVYRVQRAIQSGGPYSEIASGISGTSYIDSTIDGGQTYYYVVSALNAAGEGPVSSEANVTTGPATMKTLLMLNETSGTTAADASGNGMTGTLVNGPTRVAGIGGNGVALDGTNDYISLPSGVVSSLSKFTIAAWVKLSAVSTWSRIFDFGTGTTSNMFLTPNSGSGKPRFAITSSGNSNEQRIDGNAALPTGTWTHVAVTLSGNIGILYVNGTEAARNSNMTLTPVNLGSTTQNWIGRSQFSNDPYLSGTVDDFRIYGAALNATDVLALYNGSASALRSPWASQDLGTLGYAGSSGSPGNDICVTASGADIQGTSDNFHYAWRTWTGDGTLTARVRSERAADPWTKAGIMFRNALTANAVNAFVAITPANGSTFQSRSSAGGSTSWSAIAGPAAPYWLRLKRAGNVFTPYQSADGVTWVQSGSSATISMSGTAYLGLAVTAHNNSDLTAVRFDQITVTDPTLATPSGLTATGSDAQISLSWQAAVGATGYNVKRSLTSGGPYATVAAGIANTAFVDTGLAAGTPYYYVVSSVSSDRESLDSAQTSGTTFTAVESWRLAHFGTTAGTGNAADAADPDGDGMVNAQEYVAGTDPNSRASVFKISAVQQSGGDVVVSFPTISGKSYWVERTEDLSGGTWTSVFVDAIAGTGATVQVMDAGGASNGKRFYRVVVQ